MMSAARVTSIPVRSDVLRELRMRKTRGKTWDTFLMELLEEYVPPEWLVEVESRRKNRRWLDAGELERVHERLLRRGR